MQSCWVAGSVRLRCDGDKQVEGKRSGGHRPGCCDAQPNSEPSQPVCSLIGVGRDGRMVVCNTLFRPLRAVLSPRLLLSTHDRPRVVGAGSPWTVSIPVTSIQNISVRLLIGGAAHEGSKVLGDADPDPNPRRRQWRTHG